MRWHDDNVVQLECDHCGQVVRATREVGPHEAGDRHEAENPGHDVWSAHTVQVVTTYR